MKIEMGESLFYSWLRHIKGCQIVQTNWKASPQWGLLDADKLEKMMQEVDQYFSACGYKIFKENRSLLQLLAQGECDVMGINVPTDPKDSLEYIAVDVAFHENGLNYSGGTKVSIMKVLEKCARTAFCLHGYLAAQKAEIIFASPKVGGTIMSEIQPHIVALNNLFKKNGYNYEFKFIANQDFNASVLKAILTVSDNVADTSELFLRGYQMQKIFAANETSKKSKKSEKIAVVPTVYQEFKVGQLVQNVLIEKLQENYATPNELAEMQSKESSKRIFGLQFPLLVKEDEFEDGLKNRYYVTPVEIQKISYKVCSQWYEKNKALLIAWLNNHQNPIK